MKIRNRFTNVAVESDDLYEGKSYSFSDKLRSIKTENFDKLLWEIEEEEPINDVEEEEKTTIIEEESNDRWHKIERDSNGMAFDYCVKEIMNNLPVIIYKGNDEYFAISKWMDLDFHRLSIKENHTYTRWMRIKPVLAD